MDRRILHGLVLLLWLLGLATPQGEAFRFAHGCMRVHDDGILSTSKMRGGGGGGGGKQRGEDRQRGRFSSFIFSKEKNKSHKPPLQSKNGGNIASKHRFVLSRKWARILYSLTALNPALAVLTKTLRLFRQRMATHPHALARTYETLFFFARFKPRVSFAIGAMLRALQLTTALQFVFDPVVGIGLGLDLLSFFCHSTWPATVVLGWSVTEPIWKALGARPPASSPVPISIAMITAASHNAAKQSSSSSSTSSSSTRD